MGKQIPIFGIVFLIVVLFFFSDDLGLAKIGDTPIRGVVYDFYTNEPLSGVECCTYKYSNFDDDILKSFCDVTDLYGVYRIDTDGGMGHQVHYSKEGYVSAVSPEFTTSMHNTYRLGTIYLKPLISDPSYSSVSNNDVSSVDTYENTSFSWDDILSFFNDLFQFMSRWFS